MKIISVINQKGGSGKTTTALNLGAGLTLKGYKVLMIDADAQGNLSTSAGINTCDNEFTLNEVLKNQTDINSAVIHTEAGYDILPTDIRMCDADIVLAGKPARDFILRKALKQLNQDYDFVLIDCPPALGVITSNALTASDSVLIPVQAQFLALQGLKQLTETVEAIREDMNPGLEILGVVMTMYDSRKNLDSTIHETLKESFPGKVFETTISNNVKLAEAPLYGKDIFSYDSGCKGAIQYAELVSELLSIINN